MATRFAGAGFQCKDRTQCKEFIMKLKQSAALIMSIAMSFGMTSVPALATSSSNGSESNIVVEHMVDSSSRFIQNGENTQYPAEGLFLCCFVER